MPFHLHVGGFVKRIVIRKKIRWSMEKHMLLCHFMSYLEKVLKYVFLNYIHNEPLEIINS